MAHTNDNKDGPMKITDALMGEHAVIYELFEHLRETTHYADDVQEIHRVVLVVE
jgi:hypothetical protein